MAYVHPHDKDRRQILEK